MRIVSFRSLVVTGLFGMLLLAFSACEGDLMYKKAISVLNRKAAEHVAMGNYEKAIGRLESALDLVPGEPTTLNNLAIAYQRSGHYTEALEIFQQIQERGLLEEGEVRRSMGIVYEAMADERMLLATDTEDMANACMTGEDRAQDPKQLRQEAITHYQSAIDQYRQALPHLRDSEELENQIRLIEERVRNIEEEAGNA